MGANNDVIIKDGKAELIDIEDLVPSQYNSFEVGDIEDLMGNIRSCGLINPITVIGPLDNGKYTILSGERRFKSLCALVADGEEQFRKVLCHIAGNKDMPIYEQQLIIESSNLETRDDFEKDSHRLRIMRIIIEQNKANGEKHSRIIDNAMKYMKVSPRYAKMYRRLVEEDDPEIMDLVSQNKLGISQADKVMSMSEDDKKSVINKIKDGDVASNVINQIYQEKKAERQNTEEQTDSTSPQMSNNDSDGNDSRFDELFDKTSSSENINTNTYDNKYSDYNNYNTDNKVNDEAKANMVMKWCESMLKKDEYKSFEEEAIDVCRRLVEHFDSLN